MNTDHKDRLTEKGDRDRQTKFQVFQQLHSQQSPFVLPNAWDAISAKIFQRNGFQAIGTTSAGLAISLGYSDGERIPFAMMLEAIGRIVRAVDVPVSADIEAGYGTTVKEVVGNVRQTILAGAVGINLEDGTGNPDAPIFELSAQVAKIAAIKELSRSWGMPLFVNARTDLYWLNIGDPASRLQSAIGRAQAYHEAGADCIFIPGLYDPEIIAKIRAGISCPINLLAGPQLPSLQQLSEIGIERISCGSAPFRAAVSLLDRMSEGLHVHGNFQSMFDDVITYQEIAELMKNN